jgi:hypothetical protein
VYFLTTGSPEYLRWLKVFEPLMVITGIVQPLATLPSITKLYFTHSQHASGQSLTTWSIFALASLLGSSMDCSIASLRSTSATSSDW